MTTTRGITIPLITIAIIAVAVVLRDVGGALLPFVVAALLATGFKPLVRALRRRRVPMPIALFLVLVLVGTLLFSIAAIAYDSTRSLVAATPRYVARWQHDMSPVIDKWITALPSGLRRYVLGIDWGGAVQPGRVASAVSGVINSLVSVVSNLGLILLFMLFILGGDGSLRAKLGVAFPVRGPDLVAVLDTIERRTQHYLVANTLVSAASGVVMTIVLALFGVDLAVFWGLMAFLLNFIPTVGSVVAAALPIAMAFFEFATLGKPIAVALVVMTTQFLIGSVAAPRFMGASLDLGALLVLISLLFFAWLWGVSGAILAVPIASTIKIVFESIAPLRPVAVLMGARVPRPPSRSPASS